MRWAGLLLMSFMLVGLAGCGGATPQASKPLPLKSRLLRQGDFRGFTPGQRLSFGTAKAWVAGDSSLTPGQRKAETERLTGEGFTKDMTEFLNSLQGDRSGLSAVMQLGSTASARAELAAQLRADGLRGEIAERFDVKAVPGSAGFGYSTSARGGENVLFVDGPFLYLVGYGWNGTAHNPKHSALIDVVTKLYRRVHGHPGS